MPRKPSHDIKASVFLEPELHLEAQVLATRSKRSLSQWVRDLVEKAVRSAEKRQASRG